MKITTFFLITEINRFSLGLPQSTSDRHADITNMPMSKAMNIRATTVCGGEVQDTNTDVTLHKRSIRNIIQAI